MKKEGSGGRFYFDSKLAYLVQLGDSTFRCPFPVDAVMKLGIRTDNGYGPLILKKHEEIRSLPLETYIRLMAIRGLVFGTNAGEHPGYSHAVLDSTHFYRALYPAPFLNAPFQFQVAHGDQKDLEAMAKEDFNPARQVVLNELLPSKIASQLPGKQARLKYEISKDEVDEQLFKVQLDANSLVTVSENVFPGWKAWVDGNPAEILTGNHTFRTIFVPAGDHQVLFRYVPAWLTPLLWGMIAWCLSAAAYAAYRLKRRRTISIAPAQTN